MFIQYLESNPVFYASVVVGMIVSIVLHELAHGWAAIRQGDDTPRLLGHMTPNPVTHMGPIGLGAVFLIGIGWGMMPVNRTNFRSRYGDAIVSFAGPAINLVLAAVGLAALGLWQRNGGIDLTDTQANLQMALFFFGYLNIALFIFNLAPVPPLDGCRILANFNHRYDRWLVENEAQYGHIMFFAYFFLIIMLNRTEWGLFAISAKAAMGYLSMFGASPLN